MRKKEKVETELKNLQAEMDKKQAEVQKLQQQIENDKEEQLKMENNLKEQKVGYMAHCCLSGLRLE